ncbi:MAG TPA: CehA/McbA family metallohydrolase, partial [Nitrospira sp.]|nr:CehA/McbA family metallohydrolase [Nitrospira sp.]
FLYTGKDQKTTLDLGIADPQRFRGNSGGNKSHFTVSETDATPSYLPGAIPTGKWKLLISVPNIRLQAESSFRAEIRFNNKAEDKSFASAPLEEGRRWYRGDLHMHTADSDGSCASQSGKKVPCPVFLTAQAAAERGLDFIAITDHNTTSQYEGMRELQPYFDKLLLIPGREITTFWGHFNVFGFTTYVDYRVVKGGRDVNSVLRDVHLKGGIASINHANAPGGEICMGCKWEPTTDVDPSLLTGVEVINGGGPYTFSAEFWDRQLAKGAKLTAVGGSDNHDASLPVGSATAIGSPTTVIEADQLSVSAIFDGIRRGRVFIDLTGSRDKVIDMEAGDSNNSARMGGALEAVAGDSIAFRVHVEACQGAMLHVLLDGRESQTIGPLAIGSNKQDLDFSWKNDGGRHWLRAEVRNANGGLMLLSNPIYVTAVQGH